MKGLADDVGDAEESGEARRDAVSSFCGSTSPSLSACTLRGLPSPSSFPRARYAERRQRLLLPASRYRFLLPLSPALFSPISARVFGAPLLFRRNTINHFSWQAGMTPSFYTHCLPCSRETVPRQRRFLPFGPLALFSLPNRCDLPDDDYREIAHESLPALATCSLLRLSLLGNWSVDCRSALGTLELRVELSRLLFGLRTELWGLQRLSMRVFCDQLPECSRIRVIPFGVSRSSKNAGRLLNDDGAVRARALA